MASKVVRNTSDIASFFDDLVRTETRLYNALDDQLRVHHGIVTSQFEFLKYIRDNEKPRSADLAANYAVGVGAISKAMDRLEQRGLLERLPNPADRRSALLGLTDAGRALVEAAEATFTTRIEQLLAGSASPTDLAAAGRALAALRASLEAANVGLPIG